MAESSSQYHEPYELLSPKTRDHHRAIISLIEELEAIDWYQQRADAVEDEELRAILLHNKEEEAEHAMMSMEWLRRRDTDLANHAESYLFTKGSILEVEEADTGGESGENSTEKKSSKTKANSGSLGIWQPKGDMSMNLLKRELAPISETAWQLIEEEAKAILPVRLGDAKSWTLMALMAGTWLRSILGG